MNIGEVYLAEHIASKLSEKGLTADAIKLLKKALFETTSSEQIAYYLNGWYTFAMCTELIEAVFCEEDLCVRRDKYPAKFPKLISLRWLE